jgi:hypothetical protein
VLDQAEDDPTTVRKLCLRASEDATTWDMIGMLRAMLVDAEAQYIQATTYDEDGEPGG